MNCWGMTSAGYPNNGAAVMVIDTSVLIAILAQEPEAARFTLALARTPIRLLSAATLVEAGLIVQYRFGDDGARDLDLLLSKLRVEIVAVTAQQAGIARRAHRQYGQGRHPAGLDFGDCFPYALARDTGEPLLCKGDDFARTDLQVAPY